MSKEERPEPNYDFTFEGTVLKVEATQTFASGFQKRTIIIDNSNPGDKYKNPVSFTFTKDHCKDLDGIVEGMVVEVKGFFNGRAWDNPKTGKTQYFNENYCYRTPRVISKPESKPVPEPATPDVGEIDAADPDELPF